MAMWNDSGTVPAENTVVLITDTNQDGERFYAVAKWCAGDWYQFDPWGDAYTVETVNFKGEWMLLPAAPE